ncbi:MAG: Dabb family protein [Verrucomicrobia subdivision 3 bacterium]|nr:Dabb family protein [Limisphaerales bacterium]
MPKVKHVALLKFKEGTTQEQIDQVFADLMDLTEAIPGIEDYVSGSNNSPEGLSEGFTHGFVITFHDAGARDAYLPHPEHERFKASAMPLIDRVIVFDFEI